MLPMRPSLFNYALAHTFGISAGIGVICVFAWLFATFIPPQTLITDLPAALWGMLATIPAICLGWFFGILFIWPITFRIARALQGAPFRIGDHVWILVGKHKGTLTRVYEVWNERGQVRVELGADDHEAVTDVFCVVAICRDRVADSLANKT
jgi:hypothetical protein